VVYINKPVDKCIGCNSYSASWLGKRMDGGLDSPQAFIYENERVSEARTRPCFPVHEEKKVNDAELELRRTTYSLELGRHTSMVTSVIHRAYPPIRCESCN
jgi:hypothetical protein